MRSLDKLGFYRVGFHKIFSKTLALLESKKTGYKLVWHFNDDVFSKIDWSENIETPLLELYKKRAQQLRDSYDYLVLYYSGGADSTMVLHSFLDNGIFLDEIVMHLPDPVKKTINDRDLSNKNYYSEIEYAAKVHLQKIKNLIHPSTKIKYQDFANQGLKLLEKDDWFEYNPACLSVSISGLLRQITQDVDPNTQRLLDSDKKSAFVLGIDKPLVYYDGEDYYCYFNDTSAYHYISPLNFNRSKGLIENICTEFFYWTPDIPEIIVKQAQVIKAYYEHSPLAREMAKQSLTRHISDFRNILHPLIYPDYVCEPFQTEKPTTWIRRPMDDWFWQSTSLKIQNNYLKTIEYIGQNIDNEFFIDHNVEYGIQGTVSKFYKL